MVDQENTTKVGEDELESIEDVGEDSLSLESLDAMIAEEDPEFAKNLESIGPDDPQTPIYEEGIELQYTLEDEVRLWGQKNKTYARVAQLFPFVPLLSFKIKMKRTIMRLNWIRFKEQARYRVKNAGPLFIGGVKKSVSQVRRNLGDGLFSFKSYSWKKKIAFVGLFVSTVAAAVLIYKMSTQGILSHQDELFVGSLSEWAQETYTYDSQKEMESFYDSTRTSQNVLATKKLVANLRRSEESGPNPMGAFEFYIEGTVSEVVVEIKDRESEVQDLFLRTIEEMTFDQMASGEGKQLLCDRLRKEVNKVLTKGFVRRVFIKTAIVKP